MKEELITSGRNIPFIDPVLQVWHWQIPLYLFVGGLAAGILFFAAYYAIKGKENYFPVAVKIAPILAPFILSIGLMALLYDLRHPMYFWRLYTVIRLESPMSWGAWTLLFIMPLSIAWPLLYLDDLKDYFSKSKRIVGALNWVQNKINTIKLLSKALEFARTNQKLFAWGLMYFAIILGVYTGILLSAFNARPLWNTSILGPLFFVSGLSTAAATIMWMSKDSFERKAFSKIDLALIGIELFFIIHLFMGFLASGEVQQEAAALFLGGEFTAIFWVGIVGFGLVFPALLEILELFKIHIPISIPALLILLGGLLFRLIMVEAGQVTRYLY